MSQQPFMWNNDDSYAYDDPTGYDANSQGVDGSGAQPLFTDWSLIGTVGIDLASSGNVVTAHSGVQESAVPAGITLEDAETERGVTSQEDDYFYQLLNDNSQPVTGTGYKTIESITAWHTGPCSGNECDLNACTACYSNGQPVATVYPNGNVGGTQIKDEVGGSDSTVSFQTFAITYQGSTYQLPEEVVHMVEGTADGQFSTKVFVTMPDSLSQTWN